MKAKKDPLVEPVLRAEFNLELARLRQALVLIANGLTANILSHGTLRELSDLLTPPEFRSKDDTHVG